MQRLRTPTSGYRMALAYVVRPNPANAALPLLNRKLAIPSPTRQPSAASASDQSAHHGDTGVARRKHGEIIDTSRQRRTPEAREHDAQTAPLPLQRDLTARSPTTLSVPPPCPPPCLRGGSSSASQEAFWENAKAAASRLPGQMLRRALHESGLPQDVSPVTIRLQHRLF
jgi:hypothetical protein